jgi:hypothetical protein
MKNLVLTVLWLLTSPLFAQTYTFNQKLSFKIESPDGNMSAYGYLNTKNGNVMQDTKAFAMLNPEAVNGEMFSVIEYGKSMTQYMQIEGKKHKMVMPIAKENFTAKDFEKVFKKTGKRQTFGKYTAEEYSGTVPDGDGEMGLVSIWVSTNPASDIAAQLQGDMLGIFGIGYLYLPSKKAHFYVVHYSDDKGSKITLTNVEPANQSFSAAGY